MLQYVTLLEALYDRFQHFNYMSYIIYQVKLCSFNSIYGKVSFKIEIFQISRVDGDLKLNLLIHSIIFKRFQSLRPLCTQGSANEARRKNSDKFSTQAKSGQ